ncbi:ABC transporter permease [Eubacteriales bacterium OttesenSCG-928-A19]|nr:ABC transporter permease [Eubacteriales bacterium OttesenSCG-928-A19]
METTLNAKPAARSARRERFTRFLRVFFARRPVIFGFVILVVMILMAILAPVLAPYSPDKQDLLGALAAPSAAHWLGTDALGRDLLSRIIYGSRASLSVGLVSTAIAGTCGIALGLTAGYLGKWVDAVIMRVMDAMMSIPLIILAMFLGGVLGKGLGNVMLSIGIVMIPSYARLTRGQVLSVKQLDYVTAGKVGGATRLKNVLKHVFPNCLSPNLVLMTMNLGSAIMTEAGLSFLGMGINPPTPSWGAMISDGYRYIRTNPVLAIAPGLFILLTVWACNVCGDALRDALDPKLRGSL